MESLYKALPHFLQNLIVTIFSFSQNRKRHGKNYYQYLSYLKQIEYASFGELEKIQNEKLVEYLKFCKKYSPFFREQLKDIDVSKGIQVLQDIPVCSKEEFRVNIPNIITGDKNKMISSKTGGTTGNSMQVYFRIDDTQERFALLDHFRGRFGYKFGMKTAWFSGKDILNDRDLAHNRFWKQDIINDIRYYSTFNINKGNLIHYINDLKRYQPEYLVGFPSSIVEIAKFGLENNISLGYKAKGIFPTAETKVEIEAKIMSEFFGCGVHDQYASSEGACFITECEKGKLHFEMVSGIIEVVDDNNKPAKFGRMLITAFHTRGTPLLRYDIGDTMEWAEESNCACGRKTPIIKAIHGRVNDYIYSKERGKCNLGNLSNCVKYVNGIRRFQAIQNDLDKIKILIESTEEYTDKDEKLFLSELRYRLGPKIKIELTYVDLIPREKSGKFRIVKNLIKDEIEKISG